MSIKGKWANGILSFFEGTTHETVKPVAPVVFEDDFTGQVLNSEMIRQIFNYPVTVGAHPLYPDRPLTIPHQMQAVDPTSWGRVERQIEG